LINLVGGRLCGLVVRYVFVVVVEKLVLEGRLDTVLVVCFLYLLFLLLGTWTVSVSFEMEKGFSD